MTDKFNENLKQVRQDANMTQAEVAERIGVAKNTYCNWELGTREPNSITNQLRKVQRRLGIVPPYCFHSLRHYSASYLHAHGIPDAYIMARGGWSSPSVMQSVYRHALSDKAVEMEEKAVSAFQNPFQD